jgi:hypothetical protein
MIGRKPDGFYNAFDNYEDRDKRCRKKGRKDCRQLEWTIDGIVR